MVARGVFSVCHADAMFTYVMARARCTAHVVAYPRSTMFLGCLNACLVQPVISVERGVFYRERAAGYYAALPVSLPRQEWITLPTLCAATWSMRSLTPRLPERLPPRQLITFLPNAVCLSPMQYSAAQFLIEVPYMLFMATFYSLIVYSMIGEPSDVVSWLPALCAVPLLRLPCLSSALPL